MFCALTELKQQGKDKEKTKAFLRNPETGTSDLGKGKLHMGWEHIKS